MYDEPYLETCCRAALHRLVLVADDGRPSGLADQPCLERLGELGWSVRGEDERFRVTRSGRLRHATEILRRAVPQDGGAALRSA